MPTVKLVPSAYYSSSSYLTVSNVENMYTDVSSSTYGTTENTDNSTSYYYFYLRGFDFGAIPAGAQVESFTVRIRGRFSGGYVASLYLAHGTTTISNATASSLSSSVATRTFSTGDLTWADVKGYGSDFGIRVNCRRNKKSTTAYHYIYGAEIEVTYTEPEGAMAYVKVNGSWIQASAVYKKVNGSWVQQSDLSSVFESGVNYVKGS